MELIQVAYEVSCPKTLLRELTALVEASNKTGCEKLTFVVCSDSRIEEIGGIKINVVSAIDWLLGNYSDR